MWTTTYLSLLVTKVSVSCLEIFVHFLLYVMRMCSISAWLWKAAIIQHRAKHQITLINCQLVLECSYLKWTNMIGWCMDPKSHSLHLWWTLHVESTLQGMDSTYRILPLRAANMIGWCMNPKSCCSFRAFAISSSVWCSEMALFVQKRGGATSAPARGVSTRSAFSRRNRLRSVRKCV